jgi:formylmethanofuran dehydrogenase subunit E-like metal-binding protein
MEVFTMDRTYRKVRSFGVWLALAATLTFCFSTAVLAASAQYGNAVKLGQAASAQASGMLGMDWSQAEVIAVTNAGYAMPGENSTKGCLDGIAEATGATVGACTLLTLQSRFDQPLWFAFFSKKTGQCVYLEYESARAAKALQGESPESIKAGVAQMARIDADYLFAHAADFSAQLKKGLFGNNAFRIVTTANAAARNCNSETLKAIQVHDHFCPGVSSGIVLANYVRHNLLPSPDAGCFVLSVNPWCKEDALTTLLNATPGKRSYAVVYPTGKQRAAWPAPLNRACSVIFTQQKGQPWHGTVLGFDFSKAKAEYGKKSFGNKVLDKLHADLWFMDNMDRAEAMVEPLKEFDLAAGMMPRDLMQPGTDLIGTLHKL